MSKVLDALATRDRDDRRKLIGWLRDSGDAEMHYLADILAVCRPGAPCLSAACAVCSRVFQRRAVALADEVIRKPARERLRNRTSFATLIPADCSVPPDALTAEMCLAAIARVEAGLRVLGLPAVGALDISINEDRDGGVPTHWCPHGHAVVLDWLTDEQVANATALFPKSPLVSRPVHVVDLDQRENGLAYALKPDRVRRVAYTDSSDPNRNAHRNTRRRPLRPWQAAQLALVEHQLGFENRLIAHRIDKNAIKAAFNGLYRPRDGP